MGVADFEDLGARDALRVGQFGTGDQGAAQGDRVHDAQGAAQGAHQHGLPVGEAVPPPHDHQARQHEDHGRQCSSGRGDGLDDVVLLDRVVAPQAQDRHRDDGRGDRGGEGEADLQPQVDVRGGEDEGDDAADHDAADGEFFERGRCFEWGRAARLWRGHGVSFHCTDGMPGQPKAGRGFWQRGGGMREAAPTCAKGRSSRPDLRDHDPLTLIWPGKVACPSGRRCSTRNAVWCNSHPGFKSQRYRHGKPRGPNQKLGPRGVLGSGVVAVRLTAVAAGRRAVVRAGQLESRPTRGLTGLLGGV